jgi:hypothetical protein
VNVAGCGPRLAVRSLATSLPSRCQRRNWAAEARVHAIMGSVMGSRESALSGMRAWAAYHYGFLQRSWLTWPPQLDDLLSWSRLFRNPKTFGNYLSYVRLACELVKVSVAVFEHPSLKRAKRAIAKRRLSQPRKPMFVRLNMVRQMVLRGAEQPERRELLMLVLASYVFLLRVPSEALPMAAHAAAPGQERPVFRAHRDSVELWLPKRKNRLMPTSIWRKCWCAQCKVCLFMAQVSA